MLFYKKVFLGTMSLVALLVFACITINIYFPAEKVESAAKEIVNEIRGTDANKGEQNLKKNEGQSSLLDSLVAFFAPCAFADDITEVSNPTIRALKERMKGRYAQLKPYYRKGILKEGDDGYVMSEGDGGLSLKEKRDLKNLVSAENVDRKTLYGEVAKALNIDPSQIKQVSEIFAKEWQNSVK